MRKTFLWTCMVVVMLGVSTGWTQITATEAKAPAKAVSGGQRTASCIVKITADPAVFPLTIDTVTYLVYSSGVSGKAIYNLLGDEAPNPEDVIEVEALSGSNSKGTGSYGMGGYERSGGYGEFYGKAMKTPPVMYEAEVALQTELKQLASGATSRTRATTSRTTPTSPRTTTRRTPTSSRTSSRTTTATRPTTFATSRTSRSSSSRYSRAPAQPDTDQTTVFFRLSVRLDDYSPNAQELLLAVVKNLRSVLEKAYEEHRDSQQQQTELADSEVDRAERELVTLQRDLRELSGSRDLSPRSILSDIRVLRDELENAKMDRAANEATMQATQEQIAMSRRRLNDKLAGDVIKQELERIVEINMQKLDFSKQLLARGTVSQSEAAKAMEDLSRAKIDLARRAEEISKLVAGRQEDTLNSDLVDLSLMMTQNSALIVMLEPQLKNAEVLLERADRYEVESLKLTLAKRNLEEAIIWRDRMSRKIRMLAAPIVIVMGAE